MEEDIIEKLAFVKRRDKMSKEMSTKKAVEIVNCLIQYCKKTEQGVNKANPIILTEEIQAIEIVLDGFKELEEINFNLLNNGVPKEEFFKLQEKLKKEKKENEANKKKIKELEKENKNLQEVIKNKNYVIETLEKGIEHEGKAIEEIKNITTNIRLLDLLLSNN